MRKSNGHLRLWFPIMAMDRVDRVNHLVTAVAQNQMIYLDLSCDRTFLE